MATVQIPDELYAQVRQEAVRQGCSPDDFMGYAVGAYLDRFTVPEAALTQAQLDRMRESIAQSERGESVPAEEADLIFEKLFHDIDTRKQAA